MQHPTFPWPQNKRFALSLTFDDARASAVLQGVPALNSHDIKGTFYFFFGNYLPYLEEWRRAASLGHEIGNHTLSHSCSGNFRFSSAHALEDYTLARMEEELLGANARLQELFNLTPTTFAYPCGQKFVGRGTEVASYVPLVARHFLAGAGITMRSPTIPGSAISRN